MRWIAFLGVCGLLACSDGSGDEPDRPMPDGSTRDDGGEDASVMNDRCEVTTSQAQPQVNEKVDVWTYDESTRRLITTVYGYDLDEHGRTVNVYGNMAGELIRYWTNHYDAHGHIDSMEHYTSGLFTFTNSYDGDQLVSVEMAAHETQPATKTTYRYDDPSAPDVWTHSETDVMIDGTIESEVDRTIEDGRTAVAKITQQGMARHTYTFLYDGDGIAAIERDGGFWMSDTPDGEADIRFAWKRDTEGNVTEFTQDGTDSFDNPFVDGTPDYAERFSHGCAPLLKQFPWLAHEPAPNSTGPRFRDDGD